MKQTINHYLANLRRRKGCSLTEDDIHQLLDEAGITKDDIGQKADQYHLARYGDKGGYHMGNCRFITAKENMEERDSTISEEQARQHSIAMTGRKHSEETKQKMGEAQKRRFEANPMPPHSEEHKRKISEAGYRRPPPSDETRAKIAAKATGRVPSEEARKAMREASKRRWDRYRAQKEQS